LDGIRAAAFMLVFLGHAGMPGIPGGFGVTVFFLLSGYLITTLLRLEVGKTGRIDFKLFYLRRVLRILPPFYLVLGAAVSLVLLGVLTGTLSVPGVMAQALHYTNYRAAYYGFDGMPGGTGVYWSLAIEEHFYALFPALYAGLLRLRLTGRQQWQVFAALCMIVLAWRLLLVFHFHVPSNRTYLATDTQCDSLLVGCALAVAGNPMLDHGAPGPAPSASLKAVLLASCAMLLISFVVRDERFRETLRYSLQIAALYPLFYAAIRFPAWGPFPLLNNAPMRFLGKLSYSLYLAHQIVLELSERWLPLPAIPRGVISFLASLAIAYGMWILVEKPCARMRKRLEVYQPKAA
jgi:peptidoglycan/LPS O-acetylase OafA/YrhL